MKITDLLLVIDSLPAQQPLTDAYEKDCPAGSSQLRETWYAHQKEHLQGWLGEYGGPGAYGRACGSDDAKTFYNRFQCAPGLIWLAEALGEEPNVVREGIEAVRGAGPRLASQTGAFRAVVPWQRIEELAATRHARMTQRPPTLGVTARRGPRVAGRPRR